jgi:hypothetical protein
MRSPNEYEAAFYAETPSTNADTLVKVGNPESSLHKAGDSHCPGCREANGHYATSSATFGRDLKPRCLSLGSRGRARAMSAYTATPESGSRGATTQPATGPIAPSAARGSGLSAGNASAPSMSTKEQPQHDTYSHPDRVRRHHFSEPTRGAVSSTRLVS